MAAILRHFRPAKPAVDDDEDDDVFNTEYSIALLYDGPPVTFAVPHALPIDFDHIATASVSSSLVHNLSVVPVIQPVCKRKKPNPSIAGVSDDASNYMNPRSSESELSSRSLSSEPFEESPKHVGKPLVTFRDPDTVENNDEEEDDDWSEAFSVSEAPPRRPARAGPRGSCYRCGKGNRITEKEICIVCGAKFCVNCVLRSMGSMPEGRKCVSCIGFRIEEAMRGKLGKCSRLLKRLLTELEVKQIMKSEVLCRANQLPANLVFVNGEPLSPEELVRLQSCSNPPRKLKPGSYWYDKVSGFWGKEGFVYSEVISHQLNVGGHIRRNCSNGNTNILINNREVTKIELRILRLAGVPCEGNLHYWVNSDGSYQEEGMNNVKGKIWDKTTVRIACALLSLPILSDAPKSTSVQKDKITPDQFGDKRINKFLLIGPDQSGTSTIFKQAKLMYNIPFSGEERQSIKAMIQCKLYGYLGKLLEARLKFDNESSRLNGKRVLSDDPGPSGISEQTEETAIYSIGRRLKAFEDWLLKVMESGNLEVMIPAATREYAQYVEDLWNDPAIQATYNRRIELETLPQVAAYFLNRAIEISRTDYEPTDMDILYAEGITSSNSVVSVEFSCPRLEQESIIDVPLLQHNNMLRCQLVRVHPSSLGEKCKWLPMFEDAELVLFCVSLSDYDTATPEGLNKMMATKRLFETIVTDPSFKGKHVLLLLNKFDLLEEKIERVPLTHCDWFADFRPIFSTNPGTSRQTSSNSPSLAHKAFQYIAVKFKRLFTSITGRKLYVSLVNGLESDTVDESLRFGGEILKWHEERQKFVAEQQISSASTIEASSSS